MLYLEIPSSFSMNALYCGLDVHKESTYATVINVFGEVQIQNNLGLKPVDCYLRLMKPFHVEVLGMSRELRAVARDDPLVTSYFGYSLVFDSDRLGYRVFLVYCDYFPVDEYEISSQDLSDFR